MSDRYAHVLSFALTHPWNVEARMLSVIAGILARRIAGIDVERAEIEAALVDRKNLPQPRAGSIAIIPVYGVIAPRMNLMSEMSGGTTFEKLTSQLRSAVADKTVKTIVLDVDSPGGSVAGNAEFAQEVMRARTKKPIIAQAQYTMGSAAYQLSAAATEIVAAPSARVGSIGTYSILDDMSQALANLGVKRTFVFAGEGKDANDVSTPPSEQTVARVQALVNEAYEQFVSNVVKGRGKGMTAERVRNEWKAHVYSASEALTLGMVDRIGTLDDTVQRILSTSEDESDKRAALAYSSPDGTAQEPIAATAQDQQAMLDLQRQVLELQLTT